MTKIIQWGKDYLFRKWCWEIGYPCAKEGNWSLIPHTKKNVKLIKNLNIDLKL